VFQTRLSFKPSAKASRAQGLAISQQQEVKRTRVLETYVDPAEKKRRAIEEEQERTRRENRDLNRRRRAREKRFRVTTAEDLESVRSECCTRVSVDRWVCRRFFCVDLFVPHFHPLQVFPPRRGSTLGR
jgi:hypothetical protein